MVDHSSDPVSGNFVKISKVSVVVHWMFLLLGLHVVRQIQGEEISGKLKGERKTVIKCPGAKYIIQ